MSTKILKHIDIDIWDPKSIDRAIQEIYHVRDGLKKSVEDLIKQLALKDGVEIARAQVASMDAVDTGELYHGIYGEFRNGIGYVCALADNGEGKNYAVYVEFGTGYVGKGSSHPLASEIGWAYAVGETIHEDPRHPTWGPGWWYPGDDGKAHWTSGQPARPFMYNTLTMLMDMASERAKEILFQQ